MARATWVGTLGSSGGVRRRRLVLVAVAFLATWLALAWLASLAFGATAWLISIMSLVYALVSVAVTNWMSWRQAARARAARASGQPFDVSAALRDVPEDGEPGRWRAGWLHVTATGRTFRAGGPHDHTVADVSEAQVCSVGPPDSRPVGVLDARRRA